jgi:chromosomal replication initiation ATPase DnaA
VSAVEYTEADIDARALGVVNVAVRDRQTFAQLAARVANRHGIAVRLMLSPQRYKHLVAARAELYAGLRAMGWSYPDIGRACDRDHTSIMYALGACANKERRRKVPRLEAGDGVS